jgi:endonuclease/exonuclease/phosphatase family metal-dependent hydrolase
MSMPFTKTKKHFRRKSSALPVLVVCSFQVFHPESRFQNNRALDNIVVKGLKVENARVYPTSLSDHYAVSADISL